MEEAMETDEQTQLPEKLEIELTENKLDSATFTIKDEDHTLGNAVRYMLAKNPDVEFAGYSIPHPSDPIMKIRVQTKNGTAPEAFVKALSDLQTVCLHIKTTFETKIQ